MVTSTSSKTAIIDYMMASTNVPRKSFRVAYMAHGLQSIMAIIPWISPWIHHGCHHGFHHGSHHGSNILYFLSRTGGWQTQWQQTSRLAQIATVTKLSSPDFFGLISTLKRCLSARFAHCPTITWVIIYQLRLLFRSIYQKEIIRIESKEFFPDVTEAAPI